MYKLFTLSNSVLITVYFSESKTVSVCDIQPDPFLRFPSLNHFNKNNIPNQLLKALHFFSQPKAGVGQQQTTDKKAFSWGEVCIILVNAVLVFAMFTIYVTSLILNK